MDATVKVKTHATLASEVNDVLLRACAEGGRLYPHGLKVQVFKGPDPYGRSRFTVTIPPDAPVRTKYDAAFLSVLVPMDAMGQRAYLGEVHASTVELAPLHSDWALFNSLDDPRPQPPHPMMDEGGDKIRRFSFPQRRDELLEWVDAFCGAA
jgi:hypothetical protein